MQNQYSMPDIHRDVRSPLPISEIESEFSTLVSSLKTLDSTRKRVSNAANGQQPLSEACANYCNQTKKSLRNVIQLVDGLVEHARDSSKRKPLKSVNSQSVMRGNSNQVSYGNQDKAWISGDHLAKLRSKAAVQKAMDHWKMYCVSKRIKKAMDMKQAELISRLEAAQKLAESAKSELFKESALKGELAKVRADNTRQADRILVLESHIEEMTKDNENLKASNVRLMASSRAAISSKANAEEEAHSAKVRAVQEDLKLLTDQLNQSNKTICELTDEINTLKSQQEEEKHSLQETIRQLAMDKIKLESRLSNKEAVTPPRKTVDTDAALKQKMEELRKLSSERDDLQSRLHEHQSIERTLREDLEVARIGSRDQERKLVELRNELERLSKQDTGLSKVEGARLKSEISRLTDRTVALEKELETVRGHKREVEEELSRVRRDLETSESQIQQLIEERSGMKKTIEESRNLRMELTNAKTELAVRLEAEKKYIAELGAKDAEMAEQERKISSLSRRIDMLSTKTPELVDEEGVVDVKELQKEIHQMGIENEQLKMQLENFQRPDVEQQQLRSYIIELENDIHVREERERNMQAQMELLDSDLNSAESEIENLNKLLDEKSHEQIKSESAQVRQLRTELETVVHEKEKLLVEMNTFKQQSDVVGKEIEGLKAALVAAETKIALKSEAVVAAETALNRAELELRKVVNGDMKQNECKISDLENELKSKTILVKELESKISEMSSLKINMASMKSELDRVKMEKKSLEAHLKANAVDKAASELNKMLKSQIEELSDQLQASELKLASAQSEIRDLNSVIKLSDDRSRTRRHRLSVVPCSNPVELVGGGLLGIVDEKSAVLKSQLKDSEARVVELMKERVKLGERLKALEASANPSSDMEFAIEQLVHEKSTLMDRMSKIEDMLGIKQKGRLDILEQVVRDLLAQARPSITLRCLSSMVAVDAAGTVASYVGSNKDSDMCGCLITENPLPLFDEGVYFEVRVMRANKNNPDGLTVGVTLTPPWDYRDENVADGLTPNTLDDVPHSWAVGYNGQCWSSSRKEWRETSWCAKDLTPGQRVGVLLTCPPVSQLFIFVDDALVCRGPARLPSCIDNDYYGLVDLLGNCDSVTILWGARPPPMAAGLAPLDPSRLNFRLPSRKSVSPSSALEVSSELVPFSPTGGTVPRLSLKPTIQPRYPARPPSDFSSEAE